MSRTKDIPRNGDERTTLRQDLETALPGIAAEVQKNRAAFEQRLRVARRLISHASDGPVTPFVVMSRACALAPNPLAADALWEEFKARGWLSAAALEEDENPTPVGS